LVAFAIVLLTGDDIGGEEGTPPEKFSPRARQNVILEFGYFLAKFGPAAVCALYEPGVELPSDVSRMLYIPVEDGLGWKLKVAFELKVAGIDVDMNRIF
jgi:predicted nucleotide-binding protein